MTDPYYDPNFEICLEKCRDLVDRAVGAVVRREKDRILRDGIEAEDLQQEAILALQRAHAKHDGIRPFENYARRSLKVKLINVLYRAETRGWPKVVRRARKAVWDANAALSKELQKKPTPEQIASRARIPIDIVNTILSVDGRWLSWDNIDQSELADAGQSPDRIVESSEERGQWQRLFEQAGLDELERLVMELRQGLDRNRDGVPRPRSLVARLLVENFGRSHFASGRKLLVDKVREIEVGAIGKIRKLQT